MNFAVSATAGSEMAFSVISGPIPAASPEVIPITGAVAESEFFSPISVNLRLGGLEGSINTGEAISLVSLFSEGHV